MHRLWTPWRLSYVTEASRAEQPACIFCDVSAGGERDSLVVHRGHAAYVILNKFPYNNGHLMVVPNRHVGRLADLTADESLEFIQLAQLSEKVLTSVYSPHGLNMGVNLGKPAG